MLLSFESNMAERRKLDVKSLFTMLLHFNFLAVFVFQSWYSSFVLSCVLALVPLIRNIWSCNQLKKLLQGSLLRAGLGEGKSRAKAISNWFG